MAEIEEPTGSRSKRQRVDKTGRFSALEKLRQLKGSKHKYEVDELQNVYDEVDEREYNKTVLERQNEDWIVDDGESGYVEDGREIFDDDLDSESIQEARKNKLAGPRKKKKDDVKKKSNIQNMFMSMSSKSKANENLADDDILGDLMSELKKEQPQNKEKPQNVKNIFCKRNISEAVEKKQTIENKISKPDENEIIEEAIFDMPNKQNKQPVVERNGHSESGSVSQIIEEFEDSQDAFPSLSECKSDDGTNASEVIEDADDLCDFVGDLTGVDFDNVSMDVTEKQQASNKTTASMPVPSTGTSKELAQGKVRTMCEEVNEVEVCAEMFKQTWDQDFASQKVETQPQVNDTELPLPLTKDSEGNEVFRFYWWDAYEDSYKQPGIVYLFGKVYVPSVKAYCSCCVTIKDIPRRIYLLPREYVKSKEGSGTPEPNTIQNVYKEFNEFANKVGIKEFRSCRVTKNYAFEQEGVPKSAEYLEVRYSARCPPINSDYSGPAIERVFGTTVNALELLLIEKNIKGPCWLDVKHAQLSGLQINWCKLKVNCLKMENISVTPDSSSLSIPPLTMATLNLRIALNAKSQQNEIIMAAVLVHNKYHIDKEPPKPPFEQHYCLITNPRDVSWPRQARDVLSKIKYTNLIRCENETDLLEELLKIICNADPDLLVGNDCAFQYDVLMHRMINLKVPNWSRIGRLKRAHPPMIKGKINLGQVFAGRPVCDIQVSAKELNLKVRSYDLQSLCVNVLHKSENECKEIKPGECPNYYASIQKLESLIQFTLTEALNIVTIMLDLNVMPLALQITCIAGNILSRTLSAGRAERNEYLLLHAFYQKNYITPDKRFSKKGKDTEKVESSRRKKPAYVGGLVLEPKKGFYDKLILLMDFNSLYPSIIQEYNLCFTTVPGAAYAESKDLMIPESDVEPGIVPTEIRKLVESRVDVKTLMKAPNLSPEVRMQYNIRQLALKLTANSMYGCLGASHCRFYAKGLAALVTSKGREILQNTKSLVEKLNYEVIYGDTDSIMINTNILEYDDVFSIGKKIKQEVNQLYRRVELDIDGVFRYLLLLQKKKYAAVTMTKLPNGQINMVHEHKGLDIVRRDWCQLACEIGKKILDNLLSDQSDEARLDQIFTILQNVGKAVREGQVPLSSLVITKQLSKNPEEYPDKKQAHVMVAVRLNKEGGRKWKAGDTVPYIVCDDGTEKSATERAYHIDEFKKSNTLKVDVNYYLLSQIFPIVLRICDPIEGIDDVLLAKNLGLDDVYKSKRQFHEQEEVHVPLSINEDRFRFCLPLKFKCRNPSCQEEIIIKEVVTEFAKGKMFSLAMCVNENCNVAPWTYAKAIQNIVQLAVRRAIKEYYAGWLECENPLCLNKTRQLPLDFRKKYPECNVCKDTNMYRIYTETKLYNQICFFLHLFDIFQPSYKHLLSQCSRDMISAYETLKESVEKILRRNAYSVVDLSKIFGNIKEFSPAPDIIYDAENVGLSDDSDDDLIKTEPQDAS